LRLYGYWRSSSAWRVRIALRLKGLEFENVPVHLVRDGGEQHLPEYVALNPVRQVPTLQVEVDGDVRRLTQSLVILDYLDDLQPQPRLWPEDPWARYRARQCAEICNSYLQPLHNLRVLQEAERLGTTRAEWVQTFLPAGLQGLEALVAEHGHTYCVGDDITGADVCLVPQLFAARRFGVDLESLTPTCAAWTRALAEHPAFHRRAPEHQPDAPAPA
jgi:maleylpyruvate isomerase